MFSVPQGQKTYNAVAGSTLEWYQPPHQVAQALSYPWTKSQLETLFPTATLDTKLEFDNIAADGKTSATFTWTGVGETTKSIGKTHTYSSDTSVSVSTTTNTDLIDPIMTTESFAFNYSKSISTLNTSETKVEGSIGFATNVPPGMRPATNPDYGYDFSVMVFGQTNPPCESSDDATSSEVTCLWDNPDLEEEVETQGILWAGYTIDLSSGGNWWTDPDTGYSTRPDVALNHPVRWVGGNSTALGNNCLQDESSSSIVCSVQSATSLQPGEMWDNEFHKMKGFFVVPAAKDAEGHFLEPQGAQTTVINSDGQVWLQARVYNYSFDATGTDRLHVRFYAQEWDHSGSQPVNTPSVLVEEVVVDQCIPGHGAQGGAACSHGGDDNWILATTKEPFDPTAHGIDPGNTGKYVLFWVLVWLEDGSGNLVPELAEHGLTGLPGSLTSLTAAGSLSQTYGNNLGWFGQPIFVCPSGLDCSNVTVSGAAEADEVAEPEVSIDRLRVARKPVAVHEPVPVRARLRRARSARVGSMLRSTRAIRRSTAGPSTSRWCRTCAATTPTSSAPSTGRTAAAPATSTWSREAGGGVEPVTKVAEVEVSADPRTELRALGGLFAAAALPRHERRVVEKDLRHAALAFRRGKVMDGFDALEDLRVHARRSNSIPIEIMDGIDARIDAFSACVFAAGGELAHTPRFRPRRR